MLTIKDLNELSTSNVEEVPLDEIALLIAKDHYPDLDIPTYIDQLNEFASRAQYHIEGVAGNAAVAKALSYYLFEEEGFRGNTQDYYNPSNNLLNDVLDQRTGSPITLCILYVIIGQQLKLPVSGVSFPGHFLVHFKDEPESFYVDAFNHGKLLSKKDCEKRLRERYGETISYQPEFFQPSSHREILIRLLTNLKMSLMMQKDYKKVLNILNNILLFEPDGTRELKERGLIYFQLECFQSALEDLESYLSKVPTAPDRIEIETCIKDLRQKVEHML